MPVSERLLLIQRNTAPIKSIIIQVFTPTVDKAHEKNETFYNENPKKTPQKRTEKLAREMRGAYATFRTRRV